MVSLADTGTLLVTNVETDGTGKPTGFLNPDLEWTQNLESSISDMAYFGLSELFIVWQKPIMNLSSLSFFQNALDAIYPSTELVGGIPTYYSFTIFITEDMDSREEHRAVLVFENPPPKETITLQSLPHYNPSWEFFTSDKTITYNEKAILQEIYTDIMSLFYSKITDIKFKAASGEVDLPVEELLSLQDIPNFNNTPGYQQRLVPKYDYIPIIPLYYKFGELYNTPEIRCLNLTQYTDTEKMLFLKGGCQKTEEDKDGTFYVSADDRIYRPPADDVYHPQNRGGWPTYFRWLGHRLMTMEDRVNNILWEDYWRSSYDLLNRTVGTITPSCMYLKIKNTPRTFNSPISKSLIQSGASASFISPSILTKNTFYADNNYLPQMNQFDLRTTQTTIRLRVTAEVDFILKTVPEDDVMLTRLQDLNYNACSDFYLFTHSTLSTDPTSRHFIKYWKSVIDPFPDFTVTNAVTDSQSKAVWNESEIPLQSKPIMPILVGSDTNQDSIGDLIPATKGVENTIHHQTCFAVFPIPRENGSNEYVTKDLLPDSIIWKNKAKWQNTLVEGFNGTFDELSEYLIKLARMPEGGRYIADPTPFEKTYTMHFSLNCEESQLVQLGSSKEPFLRWGVFQVVSENEKEVTLRAKFNPNDIQFRPLASKSNNNSFKFKLRTLANQVPDWYKVPGSFTSLHATIRYLQTFPTKNFNDTDVHY